MQLCGNRCLSVFFEGQRGAVPVIDGFAITLNSNGGNQHDGCGDDLSVCVPEPAHRAPPRLWASRSCRFEEKVKKVTRRSNVH
jgi:hypothetical protein